jgi:hypothetical protein
MSDCGPRLEHLSVQGVQDGSPQHGTGSFVAKWFHQTCAPTSSCAVVSMVDYPCFCSDFRLVLRWMIARSLASRCTRRSFARGCLKEIHRRSKMELNSPRRKVLQGHRAAKTATKAGGQGCRGEKERSVGVGEQLPRLYPYMRFNRGALFFALLSVKVLFICANVRIAEPSVPAPFLLRCFSHLRPGPPAELRHCFASRE